MVQLLIASIALVLVPSVAHAYVGPGAGITAIGSLVALLGAVLLAVVGFVWFPIKRVLRARAARASAASDSTTGDAARD